MPSKVETMDLKSAGMSSLSLAKASTIERIDCRTKATAPRKGVVRFRRSRAAGNRADAVAFVMEAFVSTHLANVGMHNGLELFALLLGVAILVDDL